MTEKVENKPRKRVGRPAKYTNAEDLEDAILDYFDACDENEPPEPYTVPGLAYFLGFESRQSIFDLKQKKEFSYTIKRALMRIEQQRNVQLLKDGNAAGKIFDLTNNFGWKNEQRHQVDGQMVVIRPETIRKPNEAAGV